MVTVIAVSMGISVAASPGLLARTANGSFQCVFHNPVRATSAASEAALAAAMYVLFA